MKINRRELIKRGLTMSALAATPLTLSGCSSLAAKPSPKKILILGGTGFLGPHMVASAQAAGHEVTLFNRGKTAPEMFPNITTIIGDRDGKLDALAEAAKTQRWDLVLDNSGYVPRHVTDSANILKDAADRYWFTSSISAYADPSIKNMTEDAALAELSDPSVEAVNGETYGPLKAACEQAAEDVFGVKRTIRVRPGLIVGPGDKTDRFTYWPVRIARGGEIIAPGNPSDPVMYIDARDLADWSMHVAAHPEIHGAFSAIGPADTLTIERMLNEVADGVDSDPQFTWIDADFLNGKQVRAWMDMPVWVPPSSGFGGFGFVDNSKIVAAGMTFRPLPLTAKDTLSWFRSLPEERQQTLRAGIKADYEQQVIKAWHDRERG